MALTGGLAIFVFGYSLLTPWVLAAIVLYAVVVATGIFFGAGSDARWKEL